MYWREQDGGFVRENEDQCRNCDNWQGGEASCGLIGQALDQKLRDGMMIDVPFCPHHRKPLGE